MVGGAVRVGDLDGVHAERSARSRRPQRPRRRPATARGAREAGAPAGGDGHQRVQARTPRAGRAASSVVAPEQWPTSGAAGRSPRRRGDLARRARAGARRRRRAVGAAAERAVDVWPASRSAPASAGPDGRRRRSRSGREGVVWFRSSSRMGYRSGSGSGRCFEVRPQGDGLPDDTPQRAVRRPPPRGTRPWPPRRNAARSSRPSSAQARAARAARSSAATRTNVVFGAGNADADLMFVGEAPGANEDEQGLPFVGQAGKLLDQLLGEVGLAREDVFIANILKCRPPGNRDPQPGEIDNCQDYLLRQVELIEPRVVCTLGNFARSCCAATRRHHAAPRPRGGARIGQRAVRLYPIFHPAAALYTRSMLETLREDFARLPGAARARPPPQPARPGAGAGRPGARARRRGGRARPRARAARAVLALCGVCGGRGRTAAGGGGCPDGDGISPVASASRAPAEVRLVGAGISSGYPAGRPRWGKWPVMRSIGGSSRSPASGTASLRRALGERDRAARIPPGREGGWCAGIAGSTSSARGDAALRCDDRGARLRLGRSAQRRPGRRSLRPAAAAALRAARHGPRSRRPQPRRDQGAYGGPPGPRGCHLPPRHPGHLTRPNPARPRRHRTRRELDRATNEARILHQLTDHSLGEQFARYPNHREELEH